MGNRQKHWHYSSENMSFPQPHKKIMDTRSPRTGKLTAHADCCHCPHSILLSWGTTCVLLYLANAPDWTRAYNHAQESKTNKEKKAAATCITNTTGRAGLLLAHTSRRELRGGPVVMLLPFVGVHRRCTVRTIPFAFWLCLQVDTGIMEPFDRALHKTS